MSYLHSHINTAEKIIRDYRGEEPLHHYLRNFFKEYKKAGSKDRKRIAQLCYTYFRIGRALLNRPFRERLAAALMMCEPESIYLTELMEKTFTDFDINEVFAFEEALSEGLSKSSYAESFFHQPDLHIRVRPGKQSVVEKLISLPGYLRHTGNSFAFLNGTNLEADVKPDREIIIQDWSSQQVENFFPELPVKPTIWDACAASGGKSLLAVDHYKNPELTVTDKRSNILHNLVQRFAVAEVRNYKSMVTDLSVAKPHKPTGSFDLVIADVPCSGSGTWGRNPENLFYFKNSKVEDYQSIQRAIIANLYGSVKNSGYLLYITCSVFKKENEDNVELILENGFDLVKSGIINGIFENADCMYAALLRKRPY